MTSSAVNSQLQQSVELAQQLTIGAAPSQSSATLELAVAHSLGLAMLNAVSAQQRSQIQREATTTAVCAQLLALAPPVPGKNPTPPPKPPRKAQAKPAASPTTKT